MIATTMLANDRTGDAVQHAVSDAVDAAEESSMSPTTLPWRRVIAGNGVLPAVAVSDSVAVAGLTAFAFAVAAAVAIAAFAVATAAAAMSAPRSGVGVDRTASTAAPMAFEFTVVDTDGAAPGAAVDDAAVVFNKYGAVAGVPAPVRSAVELASVEPRWRLSPAALSAVVAAVAVADTEAGGAAGAAFVEAIWAASVASPTLALVAVEVAERVVVVVVVAVVTVVFVAEVDVLIVVDVVFVAVVVVGSCTVFNVEFGYPSSTIACMASPNATKNAV